MASGTIKHPIVTTNFAESSFGRYDNDTQKFEILLRRSDGTRLLVIFSSTGIEYRKFENNSWSTIWTK